MRILHLIPTFSGGGAERQLALLARQHQESGAEIGIVYHSDGPNVEILQNSRVSLFRLSMQGNHDPRALWTIVKIMREWRPDIVQTWLPQMDILGGIAAKLMRIPHVLSERSSSKAYGDDWKSRLRVIIGCRARAIVANSNAGIRYWQERPMRGSLHLILNAITPFDMQSGHAPVEFIRPAILNVGRLAMGKNLENMVAAMSIALNRDMRAHAYIVGAGPQEAELRQLIANSQAADRIHLIGYINNLYPWYRNADVFVSVSDFEGHPNVVLEAASVGCPLVLSSIPEHREAIPEGGALFVDGHDPISIADALLVTLPNGDATQARVKKSKQFVAELSVENQANHYIEIYREIIGSRGHNGPKRFGEHGE